MPSPHLDSKVNESQHLLARVLNDLRTEFDLPQEFDAGALAEAHAAVAAHQLPETDLTSLEFVTIDPPSSTDLDQAMYIESGNAGYTDAVSRRRTPTWYLLSTVLFRCTATALSTVWPATTVTVLPGSIRSRVNSPMPSGEASTISASSPVPLATRTQASASTSTR